MCDEASSTTTSVHYIRMRKWCASCAVSSSAWRIETEATHASVPAVIKSHASVPAVIQSHASVPAVIKYRCAPPAVLPHASTVESVVVTLPREFSVAQFARLSNSVLWKVMFAYELIEGHCRRDDSSPAQSTRVRPTGSVDPSTCSPHACG